MECYEGATMIKTFRGQLVDGGQDTIVLHTNDGSTGYRIVKFNLFPTIVGDVTQESVCMIWKVTQASVATTGATTDFNDNTMLAAGAFTVGSGTSGYQQSPSYQYIIFDQEVFNQDIYVTHTDNGGTNALNYYIELEQIKLDLSESTVATLKDLRNLEYPPPGG